MGGVWMWNGGPAEWNGPVEEWRAGRRHVVGEWEQGRDGRGMFLWSWEEMVMAGLGRSVAVLHEDESHSVMETEASQN